MFVISFVLPEEEKKYSNFWYPLAVKGGHVLLVPEGIQEDVEFPFLDGLRFHLYAEAVGKNIVISREYIWNADNVLVVPKDLFLFLFRKGECPKACLIRTTAVEDIPWKRLYPLFGCSSLYSRENLKDKNRFLKRAKDMTLKLGRNVGIREEGMLLPGEKRFRIFLSGFETVTFGKYREEMKRIGRKLVGGNASVLHFITYLNDIPLRGTILFSIKEKTYTVFFMEPSPIRKLVAREGCFLIFDDKGIKGIFPEDVEFDVVYSLQPLYPSDIFPGETDPEGVLSTLLFLVTGNSSWEYKKVTFSDLYPGIEDEELMEENIPPNEFYIVLERAKDMGTYVEVLRNLEYMPEHCHLVFGTEGKEHIWVGREVKMGDGKVIAEMRGCPDDGSFGDTDLTWKIYELERKTPYFIGILREPDPQLMKLVIPKGFFEENPHAEKAIGEMRINSVVSFPEGKSETIEVFPSGKKALEYFVGK